MFSQMSVILFRESVSMSIDGHQMSVVWGEYVQGVGMSGGWVCPGGGYVQGVSQVPDTHPIPITHPQGIDT